MRGQRTIDLGVAIRFPNGKGDYEEASTITLRAPGLDQFHVQAKMQAWVMDAMFAMAKKASDINGADRAREMAMDDEDEAAAAEEPSGVLVMDQAAIGLGVDRFPEFASYVKKVLTNSKLAMIGDGTARLTDEAWEAIDEATDGEGVMEVLGSFAGFFASARKSKKPSGNGSVITYSSPTKADSAPNGSSKRRSSS